MGRGSGVQPSKTGAPFVYPLLSGLRSAPPGELTIQKSRCVQTPLHTCRRLFEGMCRALEAPGGDATALQPPFTPACIPSPLSHLYFTPTHSPFTPVGVFSRRWGERSRPFRRRRQRTATSIHTSIHTRLHLRFTPLHLHPSPLSSQTPNRRQIFEGMGRGLEAPGGDATALPAMPWRMHLPPAPIEELEVRALFLQRNRPPPPADPLSAVKCSFPPLEHLSPVSNFCWMHLPPAPVDTLELRAPVPPSSEISFQPHRRPYRPRPFPFFTANFFLSTRPKPALPVQKS